MTTSVTLATALLLKPALIVAGAALIAPLIKHREAAARHAMWTGAILALLALPLLTTVLPPLRLDAVSSAMTALVDGPPATALGPRATQSSPAATVSPDAPPPLDSGRATLFTTRSVNRLVDALFFIWAIGALVLVGKRVAAEWLVRALVRRGQPPPARLAARCEAAALGRQLRSVRVILSEETPSPAVGGLFRPVVILPNAADDWSDAQIDAVLAHELGHVSRRDCLINLLADLATSFYWCNPLVYLAARRVHAEGELACDEEVIRAGSDPDAYAMMLLDFTRAALATRTLPRVVTAAARASELESRLMALLHVRRPSTPLRRWAAVTLSALVPAVTFPVAAATLQAAAPAVVQPGRIDAARVAADSLFAGSSERIPLVVEQTTLRAAADRALSGPDSALAKQLVAALDHSPMHENDLIRDRAQWALLMTRGDRLLEPIVDALNASDWRTQAYAAWTVTVARDQKAVPRLIPLLQHPVWRVRAMGAAALRWIGAPEATAPMIAVIGDPAWQVRLEVVEYLGSLDAATHGDRLRARLSDDHIAVRHAAARALNIP